MLSEIDFNLFFFFSFFLLNIFSQLLFFHIILNLFFLIISSFLFLCICLSSNLNYVLFSFLPLLGPQLDSRFPTFIRRETKNDIKCKAYKKSTWNSVKKNSDRVT